MFALIMAGGSGTRFWPKSREKHPKQFLNIFGEKTLIENTVERLSPLIPIEQTFVVSTEEQKSKIQKLLPDIPQTNYIIEPKGKNTAPCIGLSALFMERIDPEAVMVVLPSDHLVTDKELFHDTLRVGAKVAADKQCLVTIGIEPTYPSTGYGYLQFHQELEAQEQVSSFKVKTFAEKPNLETAKRFLESGDFLWNSGMFLWPVKTILKEIEEHLPHLHDGLVEIRKAIGTSREAEVIERVYCQIKSISIDYGVMEHARDVVVLRGQFGWNDLGSWDEVYNLHEKDEQGNVLFGNHILRETSGCFIDAPDKCVGIIGLQDLVIVDTGDALLICPKDRAQEVKEIVDVAKRKKMDQYL